MKYAKKPVIVEAVQYTGDNLDELREMDGFDDVYMRVNGVLFLKTLEGLMLCSVDDYVIRGVRGEFYPCKPDIFGKTYMEVET